MKVEINSWILPILVQFCLVCDETGAVSNNMRYPGNACPKPRLRNGVVLTRQQGRTLQYRCSDEYKIWGAKRASCVAGEWVPAGKFPVCVRGGCRNPISTLPNGSFTKILSGLVLRFTCVAGFKRVGSEYIYCDGYRWNATAPRCLPEIAETAVSCDFEAESLCGWLQDASDHFEWKHHVGATPSGRVGTGPSFDHTLGAGRDGHYMYIESSSPRITGDTARLMSPVYTPAMSVDSCFVFWYHMYGLSIGSLNVYMKSEDTPMSLVSPSLTVIGQQGNVWVRRVVRLEQTTHNFQMIVEAVIGDGYVGDSAIDDVTLANGTECIEPITEPPPLINIRGENGDLASSLSCQGRCMATSRTSSDFDWTTSLPETVQVVDTPAPDTPVLVACDCSESCPYNMESCCQDYATYCIAAKMTTSTPPVADHQTTSNYAPPRFPPSPPLPPLPPKPDTFTPSVLPISDQPEQLTSPFFQIVTRDDSSTVVPSVTNATTVLLKTTTESHSPTTNKTATMTTSLTTATVEFSPSAEVTTTTTKLPTTKAIPLTTTSTQQPTTARVKRTTTTTQSTTIRTTRATTRIATPVTTRTTTPVTTKVFIPRWTYKLTTRTNITRRWTTQLPSSTSKVAPSTTSAATTVTTTASTTRQTKKPAKTLKPYVDSKPNRIDKDEKEKDGRRKVTVEQPKEEGLLQPPSAAGWTSTPAIAGLIAGIVLLVLLTALTMIVVVRRRRTTSSSRGRHMADDSDVRFLTAEEVLDFNLARPRDTDDGL